MRSLLLGMVSALAAAGCVSIDATADLDDVAADVEERTGQRPNWAEQGGGSRVRQAVQELLTNELTADAAVRVALLRNKRLQAAFHEVGIANARVARAGLLPNPVAEFVLRYPSAGGRAEVDAGLTQQVLDIVLLPGRRRVAEASLEATKRDVAAQVLDTIGSTQIEFILLQAAQQEVELWQQIVQATSAGYELTLALHEAGNVRDLDLDRERALDARSRLELASALERVTEHREKLNVLMGLWGSETAWRPPTGRLPDPGAAEDFPDIESEAVGRSLKLASLRSDLVGLAIQAEIEDATSLLHELEVGAAAERSDGEWSVGPALQIPLPLFDQGGARVAAARAEFQRRAALFSAEAVELRAAARSTRTRLGFARSRATYYRREVLPVVARVLSETLLQYNAMQVGPLDLLQARQQQIAAASGYVEALRDYWVAKAQLDQVRRGGDAAIGRTAGATTISESRSLRSEGGH